MRHDSSRHLRFESLERRNLLAVLPGDYNFNGIVQANDYTIWKANYGNVGLGISGDGNSDGIVDAVDYTVWRNNLGKTFADVPPDPPKTITVKAAGATTIQVTWEASAFATGYTVQRRLPEMTATFTTIATNVVGTSFSDSAVVDGAIHEYQVIAQNNGGESEPSQRNSARANRANLTAFRAQHFHDPNIPSTAPVYAPFAKHGVAEIDEESTTLGPGIRINTDDDNMNGVPDVVDVNIDQENDLIEIRVDRLPGQGNLILEIGTRTALYYTFDKSVFVPFQTGSRTEPLNFVNDSATVFVEWVGNHGVDPLRLLDAGTFAILDTVRFHSFHSAVIFLGGEFQTPSDPVLDPGNQGVFDTAIALYANQGYDVWMFDEDEVDGAGDGPVFEQVRNSINLQGYTEIAIIGYSRGGGSLYDLTAKIQEESLPPFGSIIQPFVISMTSYIDAIVTGGTSAETRRPELSEFHLNQYQKNTGAFGAFLNGEHTFGLEELDDEVNLTGLEDIVHTTIDDDFFVLSLVEMRIRQKVTR